jgi:hypothetical protein
MATRKSSGDEPSRDNNYRAVIRSMIQHEDQLRNQRLGWLLTLNGFLFAGLGFAWSKANGWLVAVFAIVGVAVSISGFASMMMSDAAVRELSHMAEPAIPSEIKKKHLARSGLLPVMGARRTDYKNRWLTVLLYPWKVLPVVLALTWIALPFVRVATA